MNKSILLVRNSVIAACALVPLLVLQGCKEDQPKQAFKMPPPSVAFVTTEAKDHEVHTTLLGRAQAYVKAEIRPQVNGIIQKRLFTEGDMVQAGQPLYQIDPAVYEAAVQAAQAQLASAQSALEQANSELTRTEALFKSRAISKQVLENAQAAKNAAQAGVKAAQAQLKTAQINLAYTKVVSPVTGLAGSSSVTEGALVAGYQGPALVTVQQMDPMYVELVAPVNQAMEREKEIQQGLLVPPPKGKVTVTVKLSDGSTYKHVGEMDFIGHSVNATTGSVQRRAVIANPDRQLLPEMFLSADVFEGIRPNSIALNKGAVMHDPKGNAYVWVINKDNVIEKRDVVVANSDGANWLITSGLNPGERVVMEGFQHARIGGVVNPIPYGQKPAAKQ